MELKSPLALEYPIYLVVSDITSYQKAQKHELPLDYLQNGYVMKYMKIDSNWGEQQLNTNSDNSGSLNKNKRFQFAEHISKFKDLFADNSTMHAVSSKII